MAWDERSHYRNRRGASADAIPSGFGILPLGSIRNVRIRAHSTLGIFFLVVLGGYGFSGYHAHYPLAMRVISMGLWSALLVVHEMAHCMAARWTGGGAHQVVFWPLGGLSFPQSTHKPISTFLTALAGPVANLLVMLLAALLLHRMGHAIPWNPLNPARQFDGRLSDPAIYLWWIVAISGFLGVVNLIPVYPLDGAWVFKSLFQPILGELGAARVMLGGGLFLGFVLSIFCLIFSKYLLFSALAFMCISGYLYFNLLRDTVKPEDWNEAPYPVGYMEAVPKPRTRNRRHGAFKRARKIALREKAERDRIDQILAKVSTGGLQSLTWLERRTLRKATERQRQRELDLSQYQ